MRKLLILLLVVAPLLGGCIGKPVEKPVKTIKIGGSTTVQPIATAAAEAFMKKRSDITVTVQGGGSGAGIKGVAEGTFDIGDASRELKEKEKQMYPDLIPHAIAVDAIAIVVHPSNKINELTLEQVKEIFAGKITNWKEVGGEDKPIVVVIREEGSGTRETFEKKVMKGEECTGDALQKPSNGAVKATVATNENAIGYIGLGYVDASVKALRINGVAPTKDTARSGEYPISRKLYMITKGEPKGAVKEFLEFMLSAEGQKIVEEQGFVPLK